MPAVPIVIPVFARDDVFETVRFLRSQDYAAKLRFVIIDNGNDAELSSRLRTAKWRFCRNERWLCGFDRDMER